MRIFQTIVRIFFLYCHICVKRIAIVRYNANEIKHVYSLAISAMTILISAYE